MLTKPHLPIVVRLTITDYAETFEWQQCPTTVCG